MRAIRSAGARLGILCAVGLLGLSAPAHAEQTKRLGQHDGVRVYRGLDHKAGFRPPAAPPRPAPIPLATAPTAAPNRPGRPPPTSDVKVHRARGAQAPHMRVHRAGAFGGRDILIHRAGRSHGDHILVHRAGSPRHPHLRRRGIPGRR